MGKILIVGGGFAGINAAKILARDSRNEIVLMDRRNHHLFQPLLYQVAMAGLSPADIAMPIRSILSNYRNVEVFLGSVSRVIPSEKRVESTCGSFSYDYLILACGATHSYFGHDDWEPFAPGLKTLEQATEIRRRVLLSFEEAEREKNSEVQKDWLTFVVVGGGPTGVELAGALGEITRFSLGHDFRHIDPTRTRVILIEAGPRLLAGFHPELSAKATRDLEALGVQVWTSSRVSSVTADGVQLGSETVRARTVLWAAGVRPSPINNLLESPLDKAGRVIVEPDLSLKSYPQIFVVGDQAHVQTPDENGLPGLAPVAIQAGVHAARNILAELNGKARTPFRYKDKGLMATVGRKKAVVQMGNIRFSGFFAWMTWLVVHIYFLIGFKNRVLVLIQWAWSYATFKRGARLIVDKDWRLTSSVKERDL